MVNYAIRRLLLLAPVLIGVSFTVFYLIHLAPGGPENAVLGMFATPEVLAGFRAKYQLDQPLLVQYVTWLGDVLRGDLGWSIFSQTDVGPFVIPKILPTVLLTSFALLIAAPLGIATGAVAAVRRGTRFDALSRVFMLVGLSMPGFWLGILFLMVFAVGLRLVPAGGYVPFEKDPIASLISLFLPALTLAIPVAAVVSRVVRTAMLEALGQEYVQTARSKGISEQRVVVAHVLRNVSIPTITVMGTMVGYLLGGSVLIESVFTIPGIGRGLVDAVTNRDYKVIQALVLMTSVAVVGVSLLVDLLYAYLDPRVRLR